jgi:type IV secretory pathway TrbD component
MASLKKSDQQLWVEAQRRCRLLAGAASIDLTRQDPLWFVGIFGMALWLVWVAAISLVLVLRRSTPERPAAPATHEDA